jgi:hypothetical protein
LRNIAIDQVTDAVVFSRGCFQRNNDCFQILRLSQAASKCTIEVPPQPPSTTATTTTPTTPTTTSNTSNTTTLLAPHVAAITSALLEGLVIWRQACVVHFPQIVSSYSRRSSRENSIIYINTRMIDSQKRPARKPL